MQGVAGFLHKLWSILENDSISDIVCWSSIDSNSTFLVKDCARFSNKVLPTYFKHNNMSSFVRQLNMYGFHKVQRDPSQNSLSSSLNATSNSNNNTGDSVEFYHKYFVQNQPHLLSQIKRKHPASSSALTRYPNAAEQGVQLFPLENEVGDVANGTALTTSAGDSRMTRMIQDLRQLKRKQEEMSKTLDDTRLENQMLYSELNSLRKKHKEQELVVKRIVNFMLSYMQKHGAAVSAGSPSGTTGATPNSTSLKRSHLMLEGGPMLGDEVGGAICEPIIEQPNSYSPANEGPPQSPYELRRPNAASTTLHQTPPAKRFMVSSPSNSQPVTGSGRLALTAGPQDVSKMTPPSYDQSVAAESPSIGNFERQTSSKDDLLQQLGQVDSDLSSLKSFFQNANLPPPQTHPGSPNSLLGSPFVVPVDEQKLIDELFGSDSNSKNLDYQTVIEPSSLSHNDNPPSPLDDIF